MKGQPYSNFIKFEGGAEMHARKGWRGLSRPRGTNKRRVLISAALQFAPLSRASRLAQVKKPGVTRAYWNRFKKAAEGWIDSIRNMRLAEAERVRQEAEEKAAVEPYMVATRK